MLPLYFRKIRGREEHTTPRVSTSYMISLLHRLYFFCSLPPSVFVERVFKINIVYNSGHLTIMINLVAVRSSNSFHSFHISQEGFPREAARLIFTGLNLTYFCVSGYAFRREVPSQVPTPFLAR